MRWGNAHDDGSFGKLLTQLAKTDVLLLDDWGMTPLDQAARHDLLEVVDDATLADAILDRLVHRSHPISLTGESLRQYTPKKHEQPGLS